MFFTSTGRVVAVLVFLWGLVNIAMGLSIATGAVVEPEPGYYLGSNTSGEAIDRGIYMVVFAIVLGTITDISRSLAKTALSTDGSGQ